MSDSLWPHGLQHARLLCPPLSPCLLNLWWYLTISSSVAPFPFAFNLSQHQSFPLSWLFTLGSQSIGASASASVLPMNIQGWFPLGFLVWSPCSPRGSQESSPTPLFKSMNSSVLSRFLYGPTLTSIHDYWKKPVVLTIRTFVGKVMLLLFNMLSRFAMGFPDSSIDKEFACNAGDPGSIHG